MDKQILSGITVLDLTRVFCGPYCTMWLGDMGAKIIKIEQPNVGDDTRMWGPTQNGASAFFANLNRNKYGVTLNLKSPEGKEMFLKMVEQADVVVENYRPGVMKKMGLNYEELRKVNPRIIYASASGFGTYGPYSDQPGYDIVAQAMSGIMSLTGHKGGPPTRVGSSIADASSGINLVVGILAALYAREHTGEGQEIEIALVDSVVGLTTVENMRYFATGKVAERNGNHYALLSPYGSYRGKDKDFIIGCGNQKLYELLCNNVLKRPELITDPRFLTVVDRAANDDEMQIEVEKWSTTVTAKEAIELLHANGIPAGPLNDTSDVVVDEHIAGAREMFPEVEHPIVGKLKGTAVPIKFSDTPTTIRKPSPLLGEDNAAIYGEMLGLDEVQLAQLKEKKII
ncbi:MAG: CoA transferase [Ruminococcaceae bacterium]|nr:CoA transferase [Oscillospiraceae bacterium]